MSFELLNPRVRRGPFRAVLFDFDGTLSLIREGWPEVMLDLMLGVLREQGLLNKPEADERSCLLRLILERNGEPTLRQIEAFVDLVRQRGGTAADPWLYLRLYLDRLLADVRGRWQALESGAVPPDQWVVPGAHDIVSALRVRGLELFVASGTDLVHVEREIGLLRLAASFRLRVYAPRDNDPGFSKRQVIARILSELGIRGEELLGFGDGMVETREVKAVGGVAVGVASSGPGSRPGTVHPRKRDELVAAGADVIIPDYTGHAELLRWLWNE